MVEGDDSSFGSARGHVWLVGAGPGDPDLITVKALRLLRRADAVLVDALVNPALLDELPPGCRIIHVGKRAGCRSTPQAFIGRLMVRMARQGLRVVRLKGGDPSVFGRAAEELADCRRAGIACEIVPGITAASAAAAALGAPLTDRASGHGVALITGHAHGEGQEVNWQSLADSGLTLVVYMGIMRAERIRRALLDAGKPATLPVRIVERASLPGERVLVTTLGRLCETILAQSVVSPGLLMIGESVAAAAQRPEAVANCATPAAQARNCATPAAQAGNCATPAAQWPEATGSRATSAAR